MPHCFWGLFLVNHSCYFLKHHPSLHASVLRIAEQGRRGTCDGKSIIHPRNLWVRGSNLTGGHNRLSCPRSADTALEPHLTLHASVTFLVHLQA